jgi:FMN-binding protein
MRTDPRKRMSSGGRLTPLLLISFASSLCMGKVYMTQEAALKSAFPPPTQVERRTLFLSEVQASAVEREAGAKITGRVFSYYVGRNQHGIQGYAYFDTHLVRTLPETVMVLLAGDGTIRRVEILSFSEPEDYFPRKAWLGQFAGKELDEDLAIRRGIRNLSGASLTAEAVTAACRRVLALHRLATESK